MLKSDIRALVCLTLSSVGVSQVTALSHFNVDLALSMLIGLSFRFCYNAHRSSLKLQDSVLRIICAIGVTFIILTVKKDYFEQWNPVILICISSAISLEIVVHTISISQIGVKNYLRNQLKILQGTQDEH